MNLFYVTFSASLNLFVNMGITYYRHNQSEAELRYYIEVYKQEHLKSDFFDKEPSA